MNTFTPEEVSRHNKADDLWIILHGKVYDITNFLEEHPGGEDVLLDVAGKDGSKYFDGIGHSQEAMVLKDGCQIGVLEGDFTTTEDVKPTTVVDDDDCRKYDELDKENSLVCNALLALGAIVFAVVIYYMYF